MGFLAGLGRSGAGSELAQTALNVGSQQLNMKRLGLAEKRLDIAERTAEGLAESRRLKGIKTAQDIREAERERKWNETPMNVQGFLQKLPGKKSKDHAIATLQAYGFEPDTQGNYHVTRGEWGRIQEDMYRQPEMAERMADAILADLYGQYEKAQGEAERDAILLKIRHFEQARKGLQQAKTTGKTGEEKTEETLDDIYSKYFQQIGRSYSAQRGVGQYITDPNKEQVAQQARQSAMNLAIRYKNLGGDPRDLGITAEGIRADYKAGRISKKEAMELLRQLFDME